MQNGASAGKLLGAGAGGFILFLTKNSKNRKKLIENLSNDFNLNETNKIYKNLC